MRPNRLIIYTATLALSVAVAFAEEKTYAPICPRGQALTWVVQCDPGTRAPVYRAWSPEGPGTEICRVVAARGCAPIPAARGDARLGHEVQDSPDAGRLAIVTFGLDSLLDD